jgi:hypothetical protein
VSDAARLMVAIHFIALPTIAYGGYFLLTLLRRAAGTEQITEVQRNYFRAGHAHAGVLVLLSIIGQLMLDFVSFAEPLVWVLRIGLFVAPLLISGGFFGGAPRTAEGKPTTLLRLVPLGAAILSVATLALGVGLLLV